MARDYLRVHGDTTVASGDVRRVVTPSAHWAYAVSVPLAVPERRRDCRTLRIAATLAVAAGRVNVGILNDAEDAFVVDRFVVPSEGEPTIEFSFDHPVRIGSLVVRNADPRNERSELTLGPIRLEWSKWPVVRMRDIADEPPPEGGDTRVFDVAEAVRINAARMRIIESLDLPIAGARVIDVGSGPGHFTEFYTSRGCEVVALDARPENVAELARRHPAVTAVNGDVERYDLRSLGRFDVVHCFGLLYHLENPLVALRNIYQICGRFLLLETMVADSHAPILGLADEPKSANQSLAGVGSRPSPRFVAMALNRIGFRRVYGVEPAGEHEDFSFEQRNDGESVRDGHPLRCVFVASHEPLSSARLVLLAD